MADPEVRFIRKNGRVIPIRSKDPSKGQMQKNYKKKGDGANQASIIEEKYEKKARKKGAAGGYVAAAGTLGALAGHVLKSKKTMLASAAIGIVGAIAGHRASSKQRQKDEGSRENSYVKAFGMGSEGQRPFKKRKKK